MRPNILIGTLVLSAALSVPAAQARSSGGDARASIDKEGSTDTLSGADKTFLKKAAMGGLLEVELGKVAVAKANRKDVRKFAQHMVDNHSKGNLELTALAKRKGLEVPTKLDEAHQKEVDALGKLDGAALDAKYVPMMIQDHQDDIAEFIKAKDSADDADVRAFATKSLPMLQEHLARIHAVDDAMHGKVNAGSVKGKP